MFGEQKYIKYKIKTIQKTSGGGGAKLLLGRGGCRDPIIVTLKQM